MGGEVLRPSRAQAMTLALALTLGACATAPGPRQAPQRLAADHAQGIALPRPLTLDEIVAASRAGTSADALLAQLRGSGWDYRLTGEDAARLEAAGVARPVIEHLTAGRRAEEAAASRQRRELECHRWQLAYPPCPPPALYPPYGPPWRYWPPGSCIPGPPYWR